MQSEILAIRTGGSGEEVELKASRDGDLRINQFLPPFAMLCAAGEVFAFDMSGGTAQAPSTAAVTTTVEWTIYNADPLKHLILLSVASVLQSGTAGLGHCIMAASAKGTQTAVNSNYSGTVVSCCDGTQKQPNAFLDNATTIVGGTPTWQVIAAYDQIASNGVGEGVVAKAKDIAGLFIAPPGGSLCIQPVGETGSSALYDMQALVAQTRIDT